MVWSRVGLAAALLASGLVSLVPSGAAAAPDGFLLLGTDATSDAKASGVPMLDTWIDINGLAVATVGTDLVFHLGLEGTTTEAGQYCWMAAFEVKGEEYVGLDCYEGIAYESDNTLSGAVAPDTSRGTNVASSVVFDATGVLITIPLSAIGAGVGDTIDDIYGLTYATRGLLVVDTVPDAKSSGDADESLGSYVIGGASPASGPGRTFEAVNGTSFTHSFANATSGTYVMNLTLPANGTGTMALSTTVASGSANVTVMHDNVTLAQHTFNGTLDGNGTQTVFADAARGNWTFTIVYDAFVGNLTVEVLPVAPGNATGSGTSTSSGTASKTATASGSGSPVGTDAEGAEEADVPAPGLALAALGLAALAMARRRLQ